ncbi:amidase domain-containing protein [Paenibacillus sp. GCM10027626]|uniref:amidase domain-containing protein n=1 Tax=Paenibacillus sp. GCM10027626 TaxID=3273411 RepID=UPI0036431C1A
MFSIGKVFLMIVFLVNATAYEPVKKADDVAEETVRRFLQSLFDERTQFFVDKKQEEISKYYRIQEKLSKSAFQHEINKTEYLHEWAKKRKMQFVDASSTIRIVRLHISKDTAKVSLIQQLKLDYVYLNNKNLPPQSFGIGTRHAVVLKKRNDTWSLSREWYLDPLDENPALIADLPNEITPAVNQNTITVKKTSKYNRQRAVAYANKYAGLAWGAGNNNRYNRNYLDYTGIGGDCTNFASQVVGDPVEGGGLKMSYNWRYIKSVGGSRAWVQTDAFKNHLLRSGHASLIAHGSFPEIVKSTKKNRSGAISQLKPGDLIAYEMKGDIDHFSVVTGFDLNGYPLVNSHTADRYQVPFDLGWDKYTKYLLIHIND